MICSFEKKEQALIIKIHGDIDHHTSAQIKEKVEREFNLSNSRHMIFDFTDVKFMDSSGIGMIIGRYRTLEKSNGKVFVFGICPELNRIFEISGLKKIIDCFPNLQEAINNLY